MWLVPCNTGGAQQYETSQSKANRFQVYFGVYRRSVKKNCWREGTPNKRILPLNDRESRSTTRTEAFDHVTDNSIK